jgi:hypothetical protein
VAESRQQRSGDDPAEVGQEMEGHSGLQRAEQREMEAVIREEEKAEEDIEQAEHEEGTGQG